MDGVRTRWQLIHRSCISGVCVHHEIRKFDVGVEFLTRGNHFIEYSDVAAQHITDWNDWNRLAISVDEQQGESIKRFVSTIGGSEEHMDGCGRTISQD
jgi:hypothetical protein